MGLAFFMIFLEYETSTMFPFKIIDLAHKITPDIPLWPGGQPFSMDIKQDYRESGCRVVGYSLVAGTGTHIDAPAHFVEDGRTIDQLELKELIAPVGVIDIRERVQDNPDYTLYSEDIFSWERHHGPIEKSSVIVICTGWANRWHDPVAYLNADKDGAKHFPGVSAEAAHLLLERGIVGIGIDTFSLDAGLATSFCVHNLMLNRGVYFIENLVNLDKLPAKGAFICALPLYIAKAPEAPARVVAFVPHNLGLLR